MRGLGFEMMEAGDGREDESGQGGIFNAMTFIFEALIDRQAYVWLVCVRRRLAGSVGCVERREDAAYHLWAASAASGYPQAEGERLAGWRCGDLFRAHNDEALDWVAKCDVQF